MRGLIGTLVFLTVIAGAGYLLTREHSRDRGDAAARPEQPPFTSASGSIAKEIELELPALDERRVLEVETSSAEEPATVEPPVVEEKSPETLEEQYEGWSMEQLLGRSEVLKAELDAWVDSLMKERFEAGLIEIRYGELDAETGAYMFRRDRSGPITHYRSIPGVFDRAEVAELPFEEFPELYALEREWKWVASKALTMQKRAGLLPE